MIISISGLPGAGKTTLAQKLAQKLNWKMYSMGQLRREIAQEMGMSIAEFNKLGETDPSTDLAVDEFQKQLGQKEDNFIIEGRTSWHFIPQSFKIFLTVQPEIGAQRIFADLQQSRKRNEGQGLDSVAKVLESNQQRVASDNKRYQKYFQINVYDQKNYDYVLDTSQLNKEEVLAQILEVVQAQKI